MESKTMRPLRILALDGGGIRGLSSLVFLQKMQELTGKPIHEQFDLIGGTSTGGIIAAAMACNVKDPAGKYKKEAGRVGVSGPLLPSEMIQFYKDFASEVFSWSNRAKGLLFNTFRTGSKYSHATLEAVLKQQFGEDTLLDSTNRGTAKTNVFCVSTAFAGDPFIFRSYEVIDKRIVYSKHPKAKIWEACRATSAAPTYFDPFPFKPNHDPSFMLHLGHVNDIEAQHGQPLSKIPDMISLCDGGVGFNNPTGLAIADARKLFPDREIGLVVSVGTGEPARVDPGHWYTGALSFAVNTVSNSGTINRLVDYFSNQMTRPNAFNYIRFNAGSDVGIQEMDSKDPAILKNLVDDTNAFIAKDGKNFADFHTIWKAIEDNNLDAVWTADNKAALTVRPDVTASVDSTSERESFSETSGLLRATGPATTRTKGKLYAVPQY